MYLKYFYVKDIYFIDNLNKVLIKLKMENLFEKAVNEGVLA